MNCCMLMKKCCCGTDNIQQDKSFAWQEIGSAKGVSELNFDLAKYDEFMIVAKAGILSAGYYTEIIPKQLLSAESKRVMEVFMEYLNNSNYGFSLAMSLNSLKFEKVIGATGQDLIADQRNIFTLYGR